MTRCKRCGENVRTLGDYLGEGMCSACFRGDRCAREMIAEWWEMPLTSGEHELIVRSFRTRTDAKRWYSQGNNSKTPRRLVHVRRYKVVR